MRRMSVSEAAAELGIKPKALHRMKDRGLVEFIRLPNGRIVFEQVELDRVVEEGRVRRENGPQALYEPPGGRQDGFMVEVEEMLRAS